MTRYLIAVGTSDYGTGLDLPFAAHDADRVIRLFTQRFGYTKALTDLTHNPTTDALRRQFGRWLRDRQADDVVIFYFAGHGDKSADGRHYLLCADSEFDALTSTALATEDLLRLWSDANQPVSNLLFILDVCYAGAGVTQMDLVARDLAAVRRRQETEGIWMLAAARTRDEAEESLFIDTFERAIDTAKAGQRAPFLAVDDLVDTMNADLAERGRSQRTVCLPRFTRDVPPFVPNSKYWPEAPPEGVDLATQRKLRRLDLEQHFEPRSRGVERGTDLGSLFCGRKRVLEELNAWLATGDGRARVVTGSPGSGKSAVLGRVVMTSSPDVAIHARQLRLDEVVSAFGDVGIEATDADSVLRALRERTDSIVVVVDALDEAINSAMIARELLGPMSRIPSVRLLVGTRPEHIPHLQPAVTEINLDLPEYTGATDVADYVTKILLAEEDPHQPTPYRDNPELARIVAGGVATRAHNNFLVARMHALRLAYASSPVDVTEVGWQNSLKSDVGTVFDEYLSRFGEDAARVRRLLTALAYAEGQGLPWDDIWAPLATVLSGVTCNDEDIAWLLNDANSYVVEATENDRSVYRLYHQALVDHLRQRLPADEAHRRIVRTLRTDDPFEAHPYVRRHLAQHAAAAGMLDELITDPAFVLASDFSALHSVLPAVTSQAGELIAAVIEQAMPFWHSAAHLQLAARRCGADDFADRVPNLDWSVPWADVTPRTPHRVLAHGRVTSLAVADMPQHGQVFIVAFDTGVVGMFDVDSGQALSVGTFGRASHISIAPVVHDARLILLAVANRAPWRWDVGSSTATRLDDSFECEAAWVTTTDDGRVVGLYVAKGGETHVYDVVGNEVVQRVPPLRKDKNMFVRVTAAVDGSRATLFAHHAFEEGVSVLDLSAGEWRPLPLWNDTRHGPDALVINRNLPHIAFEDDSIRDLRTGQLVGEHRMGTVLAAGTLSDDQVVLLIQQRALGVWKASDVIESSRSVRTADIVDAMFDAATDTDPPAERMDVTLAEFVHVAIFDPGRLGLVGPVIAAHLARQNGDHVLIAGQHDGQVKIWSTSDTLTHNTLPVSTPRGSVRTSDVEMVYWVSPPPPCLQTLAGHDGNIEQAVFARRSTGQDVVITAGTDGFIRRWDIKPDHAPAAISVEQSRAVDAVAIHREWVVHVLRNSDEIRARALVDGSAAPTPPMPVAHGGTLFPVENAADTCLLIDRFRQAHLLSWGKPLIPLMDDVSQIAASMRPDRTVVIASTNHKNMVRIHRLAGDELTLVASTDEGAVEFHMEIQTATLSTGEVVVISVSENGVRLWNADSLTPRGHVEGSGRWSTPLTTGKLPDGRTIALVLERSQCLVIDLDDGSQTGTLPGGATLSACRIRVLDDGRHLAIGATSTPSPTLNVWDLGRMSLVTSIGLPTRINDLDVSPDGIVVLATGGGLITITL